MIKIVYSYPSASGNEVRHTIEATTFDEAKEICLRIEALPDYRIEDLWQDPDNGDFCEAIEMAIQALQRDAEREDLD